MLLAANHGHQEGFSCNHSCASQELLKENDIKPEKVISLRENVQKVSSSGDHKNQTLKPLYHI